MSDNERLKQARAQALERLKAAVDLLDRTWADWETQVLDTGAQEKIERYLPPQRRVYWETIHVIVLDKGNGSIGAPRCAFRDRQEAERWLGDEPGWRVIALSYSESNDRP